MRVVLDLDGDERAVMVALKRLLKRLGRDHGIKCRAVEVQAVEPRT